MGTTKNDPFKEAIKAFLDQRAAEDVLFAETYKKDNKNIDECCKYIMQEVKASGRCGFADSEIFNMAIHYYDEDDLGEIKGVSGRVVVNHAIELTEEEKADAKRRAIAQYEAEQKRKLERENAETAKKAESKPKQKPQPKKSSPAPAFTSPSLFDFDMDEDEAEN